MAQQVSARHTNHHDLNGITGIHGKKTDVLTHICNVSISSASETEVQENVPQAFRTVNLAHCVPEFASEYVSCRLG